jgi:hypothetical protein
VRLVRPVLPTSGVVPDPVAAVGQVMVSHNRASTPGKWAK